MKKLLAKRRSSIPVSEVLTLNEVSQMLKVHKVTLYKMLREGKIPAFRIGSDWRFRKDLIERWIAERTAG